MKKRSLIIIGAAFAVISVAVMLIFGRSYTVSVPVPPDVTGAEQITVSVENDAAELTDKRFDNGRLYLTFRGKEKGKSLIVAEGPDEIYAVHVVYSHRFGIITDDSFLGTFTGSYIFSLLIIVYLILILFARVRMFRADTRENLYQYKNVKNAGLIIYLTSLVTGEILAFSSDDGFINMAEDILGSVSQFSFFALPIAFIVFVFVTVSNIELIRNEGFCWTNFLGCILAVFVCVFTVIPEILNRFLQTAAFGYVNNERGTLFYIQKLFEAVVFSCMTYMECILLGTIILGIRAAKKIPAFDKDYILILGCQIRADGTLTPLLKGRADRAVEFAEMQKNDNGKKVVFVPSGGKGSDEVIAEGQAIRNYLVGSGISEDRILTEDKSETTYKNLKYSMELIKKHSSSEEPKIAFSTTNYHVFRAGIFATEQGIKAEGIGSKTKSYFYINAFVREFVATIVSEKRSHIKVIAVMVLSMFACVTTLYLSNTM